MATPADAQALMRSRRYVVLLVLAAVLGVPISAAAYLFLALVNHLQVWVFTSFPSYLGYHPAPAWWPLPWLFLAGILVSLTLRFLPGTGGHSPADGFQAGGGAPTPIELPGVLFASLASLAHGVVLGPEAPLIALGGGLAVLAVRLTRRDEPAQTMVVIGAIGSFAAISALLGNPLLGAFLLMEAIGLGGPTATLVLLPGLLASGIGYLIFVGLDSLTGLGIPSLTLTGLPPFPHPNGVEFLWALVIGAAAGVLAPLIRRLALVVRPLVAPRLLWLTPLVGLAIAGLAIAFAEATGHPASEVLFSGQNELPGFVANAAAYSVGALILLIVCKGLAYGLSLSSFRGGPIFPAMFIGAAGGVAMSHLPGLPLAPALGMGIGAMIGAMLRLPMTAVLISTLVLGVDGVHALPVVIVAVVVAYMVSAPLTPGVAAPAASASDSASTETSSAAPATQPSS